MRIFRRRRATRGDDRVGRALLAALRAVTRAAAMRLRELPAVAARSSRHAAESAGRAAERGFHRCATATRSLLSRAAHDGRRGVRVVRRRSGAGWRLLVRGGRRLRHPTTLLVVGAAITLVSLDRSIAALRHVGPPPFDGEISFYVDRQDVDVTVRSYFGLARPGQRPPGEPTMTVEADFWRPRGTRAGVRQLLVLGGDARLRIDAGVADQQAAATPIATPRSLRLREADVATYVCGEDFCDPRRLDLPRGVVTRSQLLVGAPDRHLLTPSPRPPRGMVWAGRTTVTGVPVRTMTEADSRAVAVQAPRIQSWPFVPEVPRGRHAALNVEGTWFTPRRSTVECRFRMLPEGGRPLEFRRAMPAPDPARWLVWSGESGLGPTFELADTAAERAAEQSLYLSGALLSLGVTCVAAWLTWWFDPRRRRGGGGGG